MKPNEPGIWEWFDYKGNKRLVMVVNVSEYVEDQWLRVCFAGGYYNVNDEPTELVNTEGKVTGKYTFPSEWPDRWGNRVGNISSVSEDQLYRFPD